jgi:hypothetical protein
MWLLIDKRPSGVGALKPARVNARDADIETNGIIGRWQPAIAAFVAVLVRPLCPSELARPAAHGRLI